MAVMGIVVQTGLACHGDRLGVLEIAPHDRPVDAAEMAGFHLRLHRGNRAPGPDDVEHVIARAEQVCAIVGGFAVLCLVDELVEEVRRADGRAAPVSEIPRQPVKGESGRVVFYLRMLVQVVFSAGETVQGFHIEYAGPHAVCPVAPALLPAAVRIEFVEHPHEAVIGFRDAVHEFGILGQQRQGSRAETAEADSAPVAAVGVGPPVVIVIVAHEQDRVGEERAADAVTLGLVERRVEPVIGGAEFRGHVPGADVKIEHGLIVGDSPGPDPAVNDGELVGAVEPEPHVAEGVGEFVGFPGVFLIAGHLVDKGEGLHRVPVAAHQTVMDAVGPVPRVLFFVGNFHFHRLAEQLVGPLLQALENGPRLGIVLDALEHRRLFRLGEIEVGVRELGFVYRPGDILRVHLGEDSGGGKEKCRAHERNDTAHGRSFRVACFYECLTRLAER